MSLTFSPPKVILLAVHLASCAHIDDLTYLCSSSDVLHKDLLLRILLTYLPETTPSSEYIPLLRSIASGDFSQAHGTVIDSSVIDGVSNEEAVKKVRRLHLVRLGEPASASDAEADPLPQFLFRRAHRIDEEVGLLAEIQSLFLPFLPTFPTLRPWAVSVLLPLYRRNYEYYPEKPIPHSLTQFELLPEGTAAEFLLSESGSQGQEFGSVGRDMRGLICPWVLGASDKTTTAAGVDLESTCLRRWDSVLNWLTQHAARSWKIAVAVFGEWDGPSDSDFGDFGDVSLTDDILKRLEFQYARAGLACAYLVPDATLDALTGAHKMVSSVALRLSRESWSPLSVTSVKLPPMLVEDAGLLEPGMTSHLRSDLLAEPNPLTTPGPAPLVLIHALLTSAFILTRAGLPCTVKRAGDLVLIRDQREQKAEAARFIHGLAARAHKNDESFWRAAREELLWLRSWGNPGPSSSGVFGTVDPNYLEMEFLKSLLSTMNYSLATSIYEDASNPPLSSDLLRDTVVAAAMSAYDNATNPNRTRGGLKKANDIIRAFPRTIPPSSQPAKRVEALLKATHSLSEYRLVLKQGEPFSPVVLRVHPDPISIIAKVLGQNPRSYANISDFTEMGANMIRAGLYTKPPTRGQARLESEDETARIALNDRRVTAMCIEAALAENDFETAYSYIVGRLASNPIPAPVSNGASGLADPWSWSAALHAGQYLRTEQTLRPTHLGTASGNLDIRHLEQRIECLATALRIAPAHELQDVLKTFRRCEEQLDSALKEEAEKEQAWNTTADMQAPGLPGGFTLPSDAPSHTRLGGTGGVTTTKASGNDDVPMSLFDLSRATAQIAQRNLTALSSLSSIHRAPGAGAPKDTSRSNNADFESRSSSDEPRARKRDQFRDAAVGTLVSGVGWLLNAPTPSRDP